MASFCILNERSGAERQTSFKLRTNKSKRIRFAIPSLPLWFAASILITFIITHLLSITGEDARSMR